MAKTMTFKSLAVAIMLVLGFQVSIAQTPFWTETFSDETIATTNWVHGGTNAGVNQVTWEWTDDLDAGAYNGPTTGIPTGSTGYFWYDSDGNGAGLHDVTLTGVGNPADCTGKSNVHFRFYTFFRTFTGADVARIGISTDGTNFTYRNVPEFDALVAETPNNIQQFEGWIDLAIPEADGQAQVWIQFRWQGNFEYYWKVDDLELYEFVPPVHDVTFQVDASLITVDPSGMFISGSFNGFTDEAMTDEGNGVWSFTAALEQGVNYQYRFKNGTDAEAGQPACGVDDGAGGFNRTYTVGNEDIVLPAVCFDGCGSCTFSCDQNPNKIVCDNFEQYSTAQRLAQQNVAQNGAANAWWTTWSGGGLGGNEDGIVSSEQANSGNNSFKIQAVAAGGPMDILLRLGNRTTGRYEVKWMQYVPAGRQAYYNIQNVVPISGGAWNLDGFFAADGTGNIQIGAGASLASFTYPQGEWFEIRHIVDLDNNLLTLWIDGQYVHKMAYPNNLGGINFFGINANYLYYVDDVEYVQLPALVFNEDFCASAVDLTVFFSGATGVAQTTGIYDNTNITVSPTDPAVTCWFDSGVDASMWYTFTGTGDKYHIETVPCNATNYIDEGDTQMIIYAGDDCNDLTEVVDCVDDLFPTGDPDWRAGLDLQTEAGQNYLMLIDAYRSGATTARGEFCIEITRIPSVACADGVVGTYSVSSPFLCEGAQLADLITVNAESFVIPNEGPIFGLAWAITSGPVPANTWPSTVPGLLQGSTGFLPNPFAVGYVNTGNPFPFGLYYVTPIVLGGGSDTNPANGATLFDTDPTGGCFFVGQSTLMAFLPLTDDISGTVVTGSGSVNLTPGGGIGALIGDDSPYSYQWSNGATTQDLNNVPAGTYTVTISDQCSEPAVITVQVTTSTTDPAAFQAFTISPNPTAGFVTLNLELANAAEMRIEVVNTLGQTLQNINTGKLSFLNQNLDLSNLAQGAYFIRVTADGETAVRRVSVQR